MKNISYLQILKRDWSIIALIVAITVVVALVFSIIQPFKYRATSKILIIQNQVSYLDAYTATKSAEKIGKNLTQVISSSSFYNDVVELNPKVANIFSKDSNDRRKEWIEDVNAKVVPETGILELNVYHQDRKVATELLKTIDFILVNDSNKYHGGGSTVSLQVIDDVYLSKYPVKPNLPLNLFFGFAFGYFLGSVFIYLNEAKRLKNKNIKESLFENDVSEEDITEDVFVNEEPEKLESFNLNPILSESNDAVKSWKIVEESSK